MTKPVHYKLLTQWKFNATPDDVWQAIGDPRIWSSWWHGVTVQVVPSNSSDFPEAARCTWHTPLGYNLTFILTLTRQQAPTLSEFAASGELMGNGTCRLTTDGQFTTVDITWNVTTTKTWMNRFGALLGPAFRINHAWVMHSGEVSLAAWLKKVHFGNNPT
jgi:hypothetical protein